jgi:hypothetical protein
MKAPLFYLILMLAVTGGFLYGASPGKSAEYLGGTLTEIKERTDGRLIVSDPAELVFTAGKVQHRVPYRQINLIEYGQKASRRVIVAFSISPLFLLSKKRVHFLTIGFEDEHGRQQAMIFRIPKDEIRTLLVSLEARTGRRVEYQDEEARKAGKG